MADFASEYGVDLWRARDLGYRKFRSLLTGLLSADTRVYRFFYEGTQEAAPGGDRGR